MDDYAKLSASDGTGEAVLANIEADRAISATTLNVDNVDNWPQEFIFATGTLLPNNYIDPATMTVMYGHIDTGNIIIDGFADGYTDVGNFEDQIAVIKPTTEWVNQVVTLAKVSHNGDGTLKAGAVDNAAVLADNVVTTAKILDANVTNAKLATGTGEIGAAWQSWTPTLSGRFTDADWTKDCKYIKVGKTVHFRMKLTSTDATPMAGGSTDAIFTLPVTAVNYAATENSFSIGTGGIYDASPGAIYPVFVLITSTTVARIRYITTGINAITSTAPMTWTTSDEITITGTYEAA